MCPNFSAWSESQPEALGELITYKPVSITVIREGVALAAQTVRLETLSGQRQMQDDNGRTYSIDAMILGYKGHPTVTDTNLQAGDTFAVGGVGFEIVMLMPGHLDCLQAYLRVRS